MEFKGADTATENLMMWADNPEWVPLQSQVYSVHLIQITEILGMPENEIPESLGSDWGVLDIFILEDFFASRFAEEEGEEEEEIETVNIIDDYLKRRGRRESVPGKRYLEALRDSTPSLYEVVELDPGRSMKLKDVISGRRTMVVQEKRATEVLAIWDCLAARVVNVNGSHYLTAGVLFYPREMMRKFLKSVDKTVGQIQRRIRKQRRELGKETPFTRKMALKMMPITWMLSSLWATEILLASTATPPELRNSEDEPTQSCEVRFPLRGDIAAAAGILDGLSMMIRSYEEEETAGSGSTMEWNWLAPSDTAYRLSQPSKNVALSDEIGLTRLGRVVLGPKMLVLKVNSKEQADRGEELLGSRLGNIVDRAIISYGKHLETMEDLNNASLAGEEEIPISPEQLTQTVHARLDRHYRRVLDDPFPELAGMTPRAAAKKGRGRIRREAIDWLKRLENTEHRRARKQGHDAYDTGWIWRELGIRKSR